MELNLTNKNLIIAGSSKGIGKGISNILLNEGANVVLTGRNEKDLINTYDQFKSCYDQNIYYFNGDLTLKSDLSNLKKTIKEKWKIKIDGIIANIGGVKQVDDLIINEIDWNWYFVNNFNSTVNLINEFVEEIIETQGSIIIISSIAGLEYIGAPIPYNVSKSALLSYSKSISWKLGKYGVRVNTISPGNIIFKGGNWDKKLIKNKDAINEMIKSKVPLGKFGTPEDIGNLAAFLLSERANFITGGIYVADGGQTISF